MIRASTEEVNIEAIALGTTVRVVRIVLTSEIV